MIFLTSNEGTQSIKISLKFSKNQKKALEKES